MESDSAGQDRVLERFGLPPKPEDRDEIRQLLVDEIARGSHNRDVSMMYLLCMQLFALGVVEDSLLIWRAKESEFDAHCLIDIQLLCGAGLDETIAFLNEGFSAERAEALAYLRSCQKAGDFMDFSVEQQLQRYRDYFRLNK